MKELLVNVPFTGSSIRETQKFHINLDEQKQKTDNIDSAREYSSHCIAAIEEEKAANGGEVG